MTSQEFHYLTIAETAELFRSRQASPVEVTQAILERIEVLNPQVNAFITVTAERAMKEAQQAELAFASERDISPLQGIPFATKDLMYTQGIVTTAGSKILADFVPSQNATVMEKLQHNGAVLVGKLNLLEFAMGGTMHNEHYGDTRNPWDLERFAGGSSSGSGAAVAAGLCSAALGTDTGGSIRSPANNCGIVGLKPTYGRVSRHGVVPLSWSLDHVGPMTRTVEDCVLMLQGIAGHDPKDPTSSTTPVPNYSAQLKDGVQGLHIGLPRKHFFDNLSKEIGEAVDEVIHTFIELGAIVEEITIEHVTSARDVYQAIVYSEATSYHLPWMQTQSNAYGPNCRERLESGLGLPAVAYVQAQKERRLMSEAAQEALAKVDLILVPGASQTPPRLDMNGSGMVAGYNNFFNIVGIPAISVPAGFTNQGLPVSIQLIGRPFDEASVLRAAYAYEQITPWHKLHPQF